VRARRRRDLSRAQTCGPAADDEETMCGSRHMRHYAATGRTAMESNERTIIHLDMDCFYAAIEVRDRPELAGHPVGVGGARDRRGVLTTCNYEARKFGVRSAMPTFMALQRCPRLIIVPTRFEVYRRESAVIRGVLHRFTSLVEPLSLDEAYLDVSMHPGEPAALAHVIRELIFRKTKLTASAGIGPNKLIAKIASDLNKPNGQCEVTAAEVPEFMLELPVRSSGASAKSPRKSWSGSAPLPAASCSASREPRFASISASSGSSYMSSVAGSTTAPSNRTGNVNR
jgi:DNA polymerase-4